MVSLEECAYHGLLMLPPRESHSPIKSSLLIFHSIMNVITDLMILCLPIRFVVRLQLAKAASSGCIWARWHVS